MANIQKTRGRIMTKSELEQSRQRDVVRAILIASGGIVYNPMGKESTNWASAVRSVEMVVSAVNLMMKLTRLTVKNVSEILDDHYGKCLGHSYGKDGDYDVDYMLQITYDGTDKAFVAKHFGKCQACKSFKQCRDGKCDWEQSDGTLEIWNNWDYDKQIDVCDDCYCDECEGACRAQDVQCCLKCNREVLAGCNAHPNNESLTCGYCDDCYCEDCEADCKKDKINCKKCGTKTRSCCGENYDVIFEEHDNGRCGFCNIY